MLFLLVAFQKNENGLISLMVKTNISKSINNILMSFAVYTV